MASYHKESPYTSAYCCMVKLVHARPCQITLSGAQGLQWVSCITTWVHVIITLLQMFLAHEQPWVLHSIPMTNIGLSI